ncbi:MAG: mitochondrial fission ELM1 family protein [Alphaproteobacteria bacterium]|nr:mitochondrial fission ELM1 family protein [Alphaproteobacteria bacterium]
MTTIWGLIDDRTGHTGQVLGVITRLGIPYHLKRLEYNAFACLPSTWMGSSLMAVDTARSAPLTPPYPSLVIAAGRRTLPVLRYLKKQSPTTRSIYLMRPESMRGIDLAVVPEHDGVKPVGNSITSLAPLHAVTPATLDAARAAWEPQFAHLPRPFITLCMGGGTRRGQYKATHWHDIISRAVLLAGHGSLLITTSRRTPKDAIALIEPLLQLPHVLHRWDMDKDNPYLGMLACADGIIVTGDSLSMCAEACVTGAPVFIYASAEVAPPKHQLLHQTLYDRGLAHPLNNLARLDWCPAQALDDVGQVVAEIKRRFAELF